MRQMSEVFAESDAAVALEKMVRIFVGFWASDPAVMRHLRAMAALDPEIANGISARDSRRPHIAGEILKRSATGRKNTRSSDLHVAADAIGMLTSFESYDVLAKAGHSEAAIVATLTRLARCASDRVLGGAAHPGREAK
ncbi:MAG TPA: hypothetical protein VKE51_42460 [Vicinamibacterales bacterium]|nr:hypothetical protein [Vicinamibacterales bacterium]